MTFVVEDDTGLASLPVVRRVEVVPSNDAPVLSGGGQATVYLARSVPEVRIVPGLVVGRSGLGDARRGARDGAAGG